MRASAPSVVSMARECERCAQVRREQREIAELPRESDSEASKHRSLGHTGSHNHQQSPSLVLNGLCGTARVGGMLDCYCKYANFKGRRLCAQMLQAAIPTLNQGPLNCADRPKGLQTDPEAGARVPNGHR